MSSVSKASEIWSPTLTWIPFQADLATMSFASAHALHAVDPPRLDTFLERFAHFGLGVDDPYSVVRVECDREEDWLGVRFAEAEDEGVFA